MKQILSGILVLALLVGSVLATDIPYGADSLPYLTSKAEVVVKIGRAEKVDTPTKEKEPRTTTSLYDVRVSEVLKGKVKTKDYLRVVLVRALDVEEAPNLFNSILFLRSLTTAEAKQFGTTGGAFLLVSGRYGVLREGTKSRQDAVRKYVTETEPKDRLKWAEKNYESQDSFVQRAALLEASSWVKNEPKQGVALLAKALDSKEVTPQNKAVAITGLGASKSKDALAPLKTLAADTKAPSSLRKQAVQAIVGVPGGDAVLREWKDSTDKILSTKAKAVLDAYTPPSKDAASDAKSKSIIEGLKSEKSAERRKAATEASKFTYSRDLAAALVERTKDNKEVISVKLAVVDTLASYGNKEAATALTEVALDEEQPRLVRSASVLSIGKMETGVSSGSLKKLASELKDKDLKVLAEGLAKSD